MPPRLPLTNHPPPLNQFWRKPTGPTGPTGPTSQTRDSPKALRPVRPRPPTTNDAYVNGVLLAPTTPTPSYNAADNVGFEMTSPVGNGASPATDRESRNAPAPPPLRPYCTVTVEPQPPPL